MLSRIGVIERSTKTPEQNSKDSAVALSNEKLWALLNITLLTFPDTKNSY